MERNIEVKELYYQRNNVHERRIHACNRSKNSAQASLLDTPLAELQRP
jgi:hypothetical protein